MKMNLPLEAFKNSKYIFYKIMITLILIFIILFNNILISFQNEYIKFDKDFNYLNYESNIISDKIKKYSGWMLYNTNQYYFINGIIRKYRPKKCLEIGVARGGSSILILNAIKDIENSFLVSLDLNRKCYIEPQFNTGYRVNQYFPELTKNWHLYTGDMPHKFLQKLDITFDFVFLDTAHITPGEFLNLIEILPFLKENAIIILHDITWHFLREFNTNKIHFTATQMYLMACLHGDKLLIKNNEGIENIGAVYLYKNQQKYYLDYFILLLSYWEYMPSEEQIKELRVFIKKYYNNQMYLAIFEQALKYNKFYINKFKNFTKFK